MAAVILISGAAYFAIGDQTISLEGLVQHRMAIFGFVSSHRLLALLAYFGLSMSLRLRSRCRVRHF